jgi:ubiquinone/menaquinone biosynthesis C-methylase UbiE
MEQSKKQAEHPSTYIVQDRSNAKELTRLRLQDTMFTANMGGVLPDQSDPTRFQCVMDVGCGTGGWLITLAKTYPSIKTLVGVDISARMIRAARDDAEKAGVSDRVEFHVMDALRILEFPARFFDLVNQRLNFSYLRKWDWPNLLQEYQRVACLNGVIRITESDVFFESTSPALNQLSLLGQEAFWNAGHLFTKGRDGVTSALPALLQQQGLSDVHTRIIHTEYAAGTETLPAFIDDVRLVFRTILPFLQKWTKVPSNYDQIYQRALVEMQQPDFRMVGEIVTAWGINAQQTEKPIID